MIKAHKLNNSFGYLEYDDFDELKEIHSSMSFYVPGFMFMPSYKRGQFDGKIKLLDLNSKTYPLGLSKFLYEQCQLRGIDISLDKDITESFIDREFDEKTFDDFVNSHKFFVKGEEIFPRDDQLEATARALKMKRCINLCPTSFGKSLSITLECLYLIQKQYTCLIVVPTKGLVEQFYNDIKDYATNENGELEDWYPNVQMIYGGKDKELHDDTQICISTWQSLMNIVKSNPDYMNMFDAIILDECHRGAGEQIRKIMYSATDVTYRTGWTGTLANEVINELVIKGCFGEPKQIITTSELMEKEIVAQLKICVMKLKYPEGMGKQFQILDFNAQMKYLEEYDGRNEYIIQIAGAINKTGLVLYKHISHGEALFNKAREMYPDRIVYLVHSGHFQRNDEMYKSFEELKPFLEKDENAILIANYQLVGTGISLKNLHFVLFASSVKSYITTIQAIGRGLRVSDTKKKVLLIDIVDDLSYKGRVNMIQNYALRHFNERFKIYNENGFEYIIKQHNMRIIEAE